MKYFTISELCKSSTASRLGINNSPTAVATENLKLLVEKVLDPLREAYGKPICVYSGYRSPALNKAVNGATNSQHLTGMAADIHGKNAIENRKLYDLVLKLGIPFDQIILEKGTKMTPQWIHISYSKTNNRKQKLYFNGKTYVRV